MFRCGCRVVFCGVINLCFIKWETGRASAFQSFTFAFTLFLSSLHLVVVMLLLCFAPALVAARSCCVTEGRNTSTGAEVYGDVFGRVLDW